MITTREPEDDMLEVAITAFKKVMEMDADPSIEEVQFVIPEKRKDLTERVYKLLCEKGIEERAEAEWIVSIALNVKRDQVYEETQVSPKDVEKINQMAMERATGRPLWYCIGDTDFYGYTIKVDERVLIPRPETEELVMWAVDKARTAEFKQPRILDVCTGSGCIAISLKHLIPTASVVAIDLSDEALAVARENRERQGVEVEFIKDDALRGMTSIEGLTFDIVVSNPPYIPFSEQEVMHINVTQHEPHMALFVDDSDPLIFYREIARSAHRMLREGGFLLFEIHERLADETIEMLRREGYQDIELRTDFRQKPRMICCQPRKE
jgi:release factor glutamine methyltransferase